MSTKMAEIKIGKIGLCQEIFISSERVFSIIGNIVKSRRTNSTTGKCRLIFIPRQLI